MAGNISTKPSFHGIGGVVIVMLIFVEFLLHSFLFCLLKTFRSRLISFPLESALGLVQPE